MFSIAYAIGLGALILEAQSPSAPVTCSIAPPATQTFSIERTVMPANTGTTYNTDLSSTILASLALGTMEMRERLTERVDKLEARQKAFEEDHAKDHQ